MLKYIKKQYLFEIGFILLISFLPLIWFLPNHMVLGEDSGYPINYIQYFFQQRLYVWLGSENFGSDIVSWLGQINIIGLLAVIGLLVSHYDVQKITFVFWLFAISISFYSFILNIFPKPEKWIIRLTGVLIYIFNFHLFSFWLQGEQTTFSAYIIFPLVMLITLRFLKNELPLILTSVLLNLVIFVFNAGGILGLPLLGSSIVGFITLVFFYFITSTSRLSILKKTISLFILSIPLFVILNSYYLLPFLSEITQEYTARLNAAGGIQSAVQWTKFISEHTNFINLSRLQGDLNWYNHPNFYANLYLENPLLIVASFIFPLLAFLALFFRRSKDYKIIIYFVSLSLIGIFLSGGSHPPFGVVYVFLMEKIPGFVAFRSPYYKFISVIYFSFACLIGISVYNIGMYLKNDKVRNLWAVLILIFIVIYHYPIFDKNNFIFEKPYSTMLNVPQYILDYGKSEVNRKEYYRILALPPLNGYPIITYSWNYWGPSIFSGISDKPVLQNQNDSLTLQESYLVNSVYQSIRENNFDQFFKFAKLLDIHEIVLTKDITFKYQKIPREDPAFYEKLIKDSKLFYIERIFGPWVLYAWEDSVRSEKIYSSNDISYYNDFFLDISSPSLILNSNPFVFSTQVENIKKELPLTTLINYNLCVSCLMSYNDNDPEIIIPNTRINPISFLYPIKMLFEKNKYQGASISENVDTHLGLSLKRFGEIRSLASFIDLGKVYNNEEIVIWKKSFDNFLIEWINIFRLSNILRKNNDYRMLSKIYRYAIFEQKELINIYQSISADKMSDVRGVLENGMWQIDKVKNELDELFSKNNLGKQFIFSADTTSNLKILKNSFPFDKYGKILSQYVYQTDSTMQIIDDGSISMPLITNGEQVIKIRYPDVLNKLDFYEKTVAMPDKKYRCLASKIKYFVWNNKYIISSNIFPQDDESKVFIKINKNNSQKNNESTNGFFKSTITYTIDKNDTKFVKSFNGIENDTSVEVLFCSRKLNPRTVYGDMQVFEYKIPFIYGIEHQTVKLKNPTISFKRIDPTRYLVDVENAETSYVLIFLERFSPQWKAMFKDSNIPVSEEKYHFIINGYANAWKINRKGNYTIIINFEPQNIFRKGVVISILGVTVTLLYLLYLLIKHLWKTRSIK